MCTYNLFIIYIPETMYCYHGRTRLRKSRVQSILSRSLNHICLISILVILLEVNLRCFFCLQQLKSRQTDRLTLPAAFILINLLVDGNCVLMQFRHIDSQGEICKYFFSCWIVNISSFVKFQRSEQRKSSKIRVKLSTGIISAIYLNMKIVCLLSKNILVIKLNIF